MLVARRASLASSATRSHMAPSTGCERSRASMRRFSISEARMSIVASSAVVTAAEELAPAVNEFEAERVGLTPLRARSSDWIMRFTEGGMGYLDVMAYEERRDAT